MTGEKKNKPVMIAPSLLAADFGRLAEEAKKVEQAGADMIHLDIMDGHFVPNITFGADLVEAVRKAVKLPLDVHLMLENPEQHIARFAGAGADIITVHLEAGYHIHRNVHAIKDLKVKAGISLNPHTPTFLIGEILDDIDLLLLMSVNPGFGGQQFIARTIDKIKSARSMIDESGNDCLIEVDGGINEVTAGMCRSAGADILVSGSYIFGSRDYLFAIKSLR